MSEEECEEEHGGFMFLMMHWRKRMRAGIQCGCSEQGGRDVPWGGQSDPPFTDLQCAKVQGDCSECSRHNSIFRQE